MKYYAHLENGVLKGWYDEKHPNIPQGAKEVNEQTWKNAININANFFDGANFINKDLRTPEEIKADDNFNVYAQLEKIDKQKVRAITDFLLTNDTTRLQDLENQAQELRAQLK